MKIKLKIVTCTHETKYGVDIYTRVVKKNETTEEVIGLIQATCDYDEGNPDYCEFFNSDITELVIDTEDFEEFTQETQEAVDTYQTVMTVMS